MWSRLAVCIMNSNIQKSAYITVFLCYATLAPSHTFHCPIMCWCINFFIHSCFTYAPTSPLLCVCCWGGFDGAVWVEQCCIDCRVVVGNSCFLICQTFSWCCCCCRGYSFASPSGDLHARVGTHLLRSARALWTWLPHSRVVSRALG